MDKIAVYKKEIVALEPIAFLKNVFSHTAICDMDSYELVKQVALSLSGTAEQMRVTNPIQDIDKKEIQELLTSKFKRLSINEVYYAFKLERFGHMGDMTPHYNRFDVIYVGQILEKYKEWKRKTKMDQNISAPEKPRTTTEKEKIYWINRGVTACIEYYEEHHTIEEGKHYVYEILYDDGYLPTDNEYKKRVHKDALEVLKFEYESKKPTSLAEKKKFNEILGNLYQKNNGLVRVKCFEIALSEFFRKLTKDEDALTDFKNRYKNEK